MTLPALTNEILCWKAVLIMIASTTGAVTSDLAPHSTIKFAPASPLVSSSATTKSVETIGASQILSVFIRVPSCRIG
jgi:hypothetical protein